MGLLTKLTQPFKRKSVQYVQSADYGRPHWTTQRDEQFITQGYNKIVWVYACVSMISNCVANVPWVLYRRRGGKLIEIEEHPILNMVNNKANEYFDSKQFFEAWASYLALNGKFYAELNSEAYPTQMFWIPPYLVKPIPDKRNFILGYEYEVSGATKTYKPDSIIFSRFLDPLDVYGGLSPIRAMSRTIDSENKAVDWNKSTLDNAGIPPGALKVINPGPDLIENLKNDWLKRYAGAKNARIPLIIDSEKADYINFGINAIDLDFLNQRKLNSVEICAGFGVPSQVVGDTQGQKYANYEEAVKALWQLTIIPKYLSKIKGDLNRCICSKYADNLYLDYNLDNITALHESIDNISKRTGNLYKSNIITQNEARVALGYSEQDGKDEFYYESLINRRPQL